MKKLDSRGVAHFAALAIIVLGVASYGTYKLVASHAATLNSASCQASNVQLSAASHSTGPCVTFVQQKVGASPDGDFGPLTASKVVVFQKAHNIVADGIVGPCTWAAVNGTAIPTTCLVIKPAPVVAKPVTVAPKPVTVAPQPVAVAATPAVAAPKSVTPAPAVCQPTTRPYLSASNNSQHACVQYIQRLVGATPDGNFGPATASKVKIYQGQHGLTQDGTVGPCTWTAILGGATTAACKAPTQATTTQPTTTTTYTGNGQTTTTTATKPTTTTTATKPTTTTTYTGNGRTTTKTSNAPTPKTAGPSIWHRIGSFFNHISGSS